MELVKDFPVDKLKQADYNPRLMEEETHRQLSESLERFGLVDPIIFNTKTGVIIAGNQRYEHIKDTHESGHALILGDIGWFFTDEDIKLEGEADEKALNIALNKISGEFHDEQLKIILEELVTLDTPPVGFTDDELLNIIAPDIPEPDKPLLDSQPDPTMTPGDLQPRQATEKTDTYPITEGAEWDILGHTIKLGPPTDNYNLYARILIRGGDLKIFLIGEGAEQAWEEFKQKNKNNIKTARNNTQT